ncbi:MAG: hypothetical protein ABID38_02400 [Candidatus Diapherotrites archaeon]
MGEDKGAEIKIRPNNAGPFHVFDEKTGEFIGKEVKYGDATELQKKLFELGVRQKKIPVRVTLRGCATGHSNVLYGQYLRLVKDYFLDQLPLNKWMSYEEMLSNFKNQLDREIIRRSVGERHHTIGVFVDRKYDLKKKVIEYRLTELTKIRNRIEENNLSQDYVLENSQDLKEKESDKGKYLDITNLTDKLFKAIPPEPVSYQEIFGHLNDEEKESVLETLPLNPSLLVYSRIISNFSFSKFGVFLDYWYDKKHKTYYFKKNFTIKCPDCRQSLNNYTLEGTDEVEGKVNFICENCKKRLIKHINEIVDSDASK